MVNRCNNVIITQIALTKSTLSAQNSLNVVWLRPDQLRSLSAPPDSLSVAGRKCGNKERRKRRREEGKKKKGKREAAHPWSFLSAARSFAHSTHNLRNELLRTQRVLMSVSHTFKADIELLIFAWIFRNSWPKLGIFGAKWGIGGATLTLNELVFTFGVLTQFGTLAIRKLSVKISRRSSQGNPSVGGVKHKMGSQI